MIQINTNKIRIISIISTISILVSYRFSSRQSGPASSFSEVSWIDVINLKDIMENKVPPKKLLQSSYRKEMWKNVEEIVRKIEQVLPISSMHLMGSFTSNKRRPADVDFIVMLQTPTNQKHKQWSLDLVIAPDNKHGKELLEDNKKWMKQKYGSKKSEVIRYR